MDKLCLQFVLMAMLRQTTRGLETFGTKNGDIAMVKMMVLCWSFGVKTWSCERLQCSCVAPIFPSMYQNLCMLNFGETYPKHSEASAGEEHIISLDMFEDVNKHIPNIVGKKLL